MRMLSSSNSWYHMALCCGEPSRLIVPKTAPLRSCRKARALSERALLIGDIFPQNVFSLVEEVPLHKKSKSGFRNHFWSSAMKLVQKWFPKPLLDKFQIGLRTTCFYAK